MASENLLTHGFLAGVRHCSWQSQNTVLGDSRGLTERQWLGNHKFLDEIDLSDGCFLSPRTTMLVNERASQIATARYRLKLPAVSPRAPHPFAPSKLEALERRTQKAKDEKDKLKIITAAVDCLDYMKKVREKRRRRREKKQERRKKREEKRKVRKLRDDEAEDGFGDWRAMRIHQRTLDTFDEVELGKYKAVFKAFDADGGGTIDNEELACLTSALGIKVSPELLKKVDQDGDGLLDFSEYLLLMTDLKNSGVIHKSQPEEQAEAVFSIEELCQHRDMFDMYDEDGGGTIDAEELKNLTSNLDIEMSPELLEKIDQDGDGLLDFGEFLLLMLDVKQREKEKERRKAQKRRKGAQKYGKSEKRERKNASSMGGKKQSDNNNLDLKVERKSRRSKSKGRPPSAESRPLRRFVGFVNAICNMPASRVNRRTICFLLYKMLPRSDLECSDLRETIAVMLRTCHLSLDDLYAFCDLYYGDQRNNLNLEAAKIQTHAKGTRNVHKKEAFNHTFYGGRERKQVDQVVDKDHILLIKSRGKKCGNRRKYSVRGSDRVPYFNTLNPVNPNKESRIARGVLEMKTDASADRASFGNAHKLKLQPEFLHPPASISPRPPPGERPNDGGRLKWKRSGMRRHHRRPH